MKIYAVMGTRGEYSDRTEWAVVAFDDEEKAQERVVLATKRAQEIHAVADAHTDRKGTANFDALVNVYDSDTDAMEGVTTTATDDEIEARCWEIISTSVASYFYYEVDLITQSWLEEKK